ncbi:unnamed protein product [Mesocestoides corti]|uniref:F-box domain-containing protein n=2 Tax=Mesocestoides corti TaxID=53468 RepID=A0A0R3U244_MESCO|nr:unnamed protein product [Mesocestoides corti]
MADIFPLPTEIMQKICNFLPVEDVLSLSSVCDKFASAINQPSFWQQRLRNRVHSLYPCFPGKSFDRIILAWIVPDLTFGTASSARGLFALGDRGGTFSLFSLKDFISLDEPKPLYSNTHTHGGWLWTISSDYNVVATARCITFFRMNSSVLCSDFVDQNLVAAGTFRKLLTVFDFRVPSEKPALSNTFHQSTVLCLESPYSIWKNSEDALGSLFSSTSTLNFSDADSLVSSMGDSSLNESVIANSDPGTPRSPINPARDSPLLPSVSSNIAFYSGSEDGLLAAWDMRQFKKPVAEIKMESYPREISLLDTEEMWVAEHPNRLHVFRTGCSRTTEKSPLLSLVNSHSFSAESGSICALEATPGAVFLARTCGSLSVLHPTMPPVSMLSTPICTDRNSPPVSLSFANETLLVGGGGGYVSLWMSKRQADQYHETGASEGSL